jgi:molybdenum cofactor cytidylyltransferase
MQKIDTTPTTAAIILAAGTSSRMEGGRHKLLLPLHDRPVLAHVLDAVLASKSRPILLILGHQANHVRSQIVQYTGHTSITIIENKDYKEGMSTSLRLGIQALHAHSSQHIDSILVLLGDQPLISARLLDTLIGTFRQTGKNIVAPLYNGKRGNPVLFGKSLFDELALVSGDEGGRSVLNRHKDEIATVEVGDVQASYDVDTWEAYQQVLAAWKTQHMQKRNNIDG